MKRNWHKGFGKLITCSACNDSWVSLALPRENNPFTMACKKGWRELAEARQFKIRDALVFDECLELLVA